MDLFFATLRCIEKEDFVEYSFLQLKVSKTIFNNWSSSWTTTCVIPPCIEKPAENLFFIKNCSIFSSLKKRAELVRMWTSRFQTAEHVRCSDNGLKNVRSFGSSLGNIFLLMNFFLENKIHLRDCMKSRGPHVVTYFPASSKLQQISKTISWINWNERPRRKLISKCHWEEKKFEKYF